MTALAPTTAEFTIDAISADVLLSWMGNNGIHGDVELYDGGVNDWSGETFFGFTADHLPTETEIMDALIRAAKIARLYHGERLADDSLIVRLSEDGSVAERILSKIGIREGHTSVQIVFWNVALV